MKVNFDAAFFSDNSKVGVGVIMRGDDDSFLFTLAELGMVRSAEVVECLAARSGLLKARDMGLRNVSLEGDCKRVIAFLLGDELLWPLEIKCILTNCKTIMSCFDLCLFVWVKRSANNVAHVLASKGLSVSSSWTGRPSDWLAQPLELDLPPQLLAFFNAIFFLPKKKRTQVNNSKM